MSKINLVIFTQMKKIDPNAKVYGEPKRHIQ